MTITDAELAVMNCLWDHGECTKRDLAEQLYQSQTESDLATVQKLLQRLEAKGYVRRRRSAPAHVFSASQPREQFAGTQLREVAERMSGGSLVPLVMSLIEGRVLSKSERRRLRDVLDETDGSAKRKR